nr:discoidin domain containing receptor 2 [Hymenolepis microstoma]
MQIFAFEWSSSQPSLDEWVLIEHANNNTTTAAAAYIRVHKQDHNDSIYLANFSQSVEVVRRGPSDERACDSRLMDTPAKVPDTAFSASSVRQNLPEFRPFHARLGSLYAGKDQTSGQAWCPNNTVQSSMNEWIQVDFPQLTIICTIFTTGRGDGNVAEYMPYFILHYQREDGGPWHEYTTRESERVIQGNIDPRNTARHTFDPVVIARRIRIYPYSAKSQHRVCLRFALKGCPFPDGITEYVATEGSRGPLGSDRYQHFDFRDRTNDANKALGPRGAPGGLGKLVDNVAHLGNVTQDLSSLNHHFVGWERSRSGPVRIDFKFDKLRNFSRLLIFTYESPRLRIGLANYTVIDFIRDGETLSTTQETQITLPLNPPDKIDTWDRTDVSWREALHRASSSRVTVFRNPLWDGAVILNIPLQGHIAQDVSLQLFYSNEWLLISEVQFISEPYVPIASQPSSSSQQRELDETIDNPEIRFPASFGPVGGEDHPFPSDRAQQGITTAAVSTDSTDIDKVSNGDGSGGAGGSSSTVTHRQDIADEQIQANGRSTTFVVVIAVSLLLSVLCVLLVSLCIRMQHSRQQHQSLKKITSTGTPGGITSPITSAHPTHPLNGGGCGGMVDQHDVMSQQLYQPGVSICSNLTSTGACTVSPAAFLFSPAHSTGAGAMYAAGAPPLQVLSSPSMFSGPDGCPAGQPSPGHNFASLAGGDIATLQQLGLRHQQQFYPPIGMIHQVTCGDTTTDSGSLYTTPPALCPILAGTIPRNSRHNKGRSGFSVASSEEEDDGGEVSANEAGDEGEGDDEDGENMRRRPPVARAERSSVTASSASEGAQRNSTSTANEGAGGGDESISTETNENLALLRPNLTSNGTSGRRKRPTKHRRQCNQNGISSRTATESLQTISTTAPFPRTMLHPSQPFAAQPFPGADMLGTEYASTSLFGSSTASNHGGHSGTMKKGSSSLLDPCGSQYPSPYLQNCGQNSSATVGVNGNTSYHLYQPIFVPQQQAHLFAAAGGFMDTHQLGGLVQTSPFLSQGMLHSTVPHTAAYNPEASIAATTTTANGVVGGGWPVQQESGALKSSSGTPLPPVPSRPLPLNPHLTNHQGLHYSSTNDGASSGRLSIYSLFYADGGIASFDINTEESEQAAMGLYTILI